MNQFEKNAQQVLEFFYTYELECGHPCTGLCDEAYEVFDEVQPEIEGFTYLGAGGSRVAYAKDGFVYKVEYGPAMGQGNQWTRPQNIAEYENYLRISELTLPNSWRVPATDLLKLDFPVILMEHIDGDLNFDFEYTDEHDEFLAATGLTDIYWSNVVFSEGYWYVVDMGV